MTASHLSFFTKDNEINPMELFIKNRIGRFGIIYMIPFKKYLHQRQSSRSMLDILIRSEMNIAIFTSQFDYRKGLKLQCKCLRNAYNKYMNNNINNDRNRKTKDSKASKDDFDFDNGSDFSANLNNNV